MNILSIALVVLVVLVGDAQARGLVIPTDPTGRYDVLYLKEEGQYRVLATKRSGSSGISFSKIKIDCKANKFQGLGQGDTEEEMEKPQVTPKFYDVVNGSIKYYQVRYACSKEK